VRRKPESEEDWACNPLSKTENTKKPPIPVHMRVMRPNPLFVEIPSYLSNRSLHPTEQPQLENMIAGPDNSSNKDAYIFLKIWIVNNFRK
jgi:hypothetical protein